jgi:hypothetical protein
MHFFQGEAFDSGSNLVHSQFIQYICLLLRLHYAGLVCQLLSYLATQGTQRIVNHTHRPKQKKQRSDPECWTQRFPRENTGCRFVVGKAGISI